MSILHRVKPEVLQRPRRSTIPRPNENHCWQALMEISVDALVVLNDDFRVVQASQTFAEMLGLDMAEIETMHAWDWDAVMTKEEILHHFRLVGPDRGKLDFATRLRRGDGTLIDASIRVTWTHSGNSIFPVCVVRERSRDKVAQQALHPATSVLAQAGRDLDEGERRWNHALESAGQGVWEWDIANPQTQGNPRWKQMRGYEPEEPTDFSHEGWLSRIHPDDLARVRDVIAGQRNGAQEYNAFEYRERDKDGHYIWISSVGAAVEWGRLPEIFVAGAAAIEVTGRYSVRQRTGIGRHGAAEGPATSLTLIQLGSGEPSVKVTKNSMGRRPDR